MNQNQTHPKPPSAEQPTDEGLDETACCALRGRALYEADCKKRPNYHDGKPRKTWDQLGDVEQWSWSRPAVMLKEGDDLGNLQPNLESLTHDGAWKPSPITCGKVEPLLVGRLRVVRHNA